MKLTFLAFFVTFAVPALADAPAGASATPCDPDAFVLNSLGQWNNPTCTSPGGATAKPHLVEEATESKEG